MELLFSLLSLIFRKGKNKFDSGETRVVGSAETDASTKELTLPFIQEKRNPRFRRTSKPRLVRRTHFLLRQKIQGRRRSGTQTKSFQSGSQRKGFLLLYHHLVGMPTRSHESFESISKLTHNLRFNQHFPKREFDPSQGKVVIETIQRRDSMLNSIKKPFFQRAKPSPHSSLVSFLPTPP